MTANQQLPEKVTREIASLRRSREVINRFVTLVERRAEAKMLKTSKLEGAHYAAMKELQKAINEETKDQ
jgi:hypothetical protein